MERNERWRPAPGGCSISHPRVTAGTLGAYLWLDGKPYIVSNSHVIADSGTALIGDEVIQPGSFDGGLAPDDIIGHLSFFVPYKVGEPNNVDLAIAEAVPEMMDDRILGLEPGTQILEVLPGEPNPNDRVMKSGRTTGLTHGTIVSTDMTLDVLFPQGMLTFEDCLVILGASAGGDSGSAIISSNGDLLGLLFAGDPDHSVFIACKIGNIINALEQAPLFRNAVPALEVPSMRWGIPLFFGGILAANGLYFSRRKG